VAVNPATNRVYVANMGSGTVAVIDGAADRVVATIPVGLHPAQLAVNPETNRVYVTNRRSASVSVVDGAANRVIATIPITSGPATEGRTRLPTRGRAISRHLADQAGFPARGAAGGESAVGASVALGPGKLGW
jgi:YVTN family beta-propeller protein